jgi:hypothetical protein
VADYATSIIAIDRPARVADLERARASADVPAEAYAEVQCLCGGREFWVDYRDDTVKIECRSCCRMMAFAIAP